MESIVRYQQGRVPALLGAIKNAFLAAIKISFGVLGHSHALVADGVHSLADLLTDALVIIATRYGSRGADKDHPYGHRRIETAATVGLAFILTLAGFGIILDASQEIWGTRVAMQPHVYVLWVALLSIVANEALYFYTRRVARQIRSNLLSANAWHHRSDSASSLVVLIGVTGSLLGWLRLDAIAAFIVGILIIRMAWQFGWSSLQELIDTGLDNNTIEKIKTTIQTVSGVCALHQLRTRSMGGAVYLDVHILVDPTLSVSEGHYIGQQVHYQLMKNFVEIADVTVHVDPEDDEVNTPSLNLAARADIVQLLKQRWQGLVAEQYIESVILHYLGGKVYIELPLPLTTADQLGVLMPRLRSAIQGIPVLGQLTVICTDTDFRNFRRCATLNES